MTASAGSQAAAARTALAGPPGNRRIDAWWAATVLIAVAGAVLTVVAWSGLKANDAYSNLGAAVAAAGYATIGALIYRRVRNPIGWLLLSEGAGLAFICLASAYAVAGVTVHPGALPAARQVGAVAEWAFFPIVAALALALLLFPSGTLPSPRWRPVVTFNLLAMVALLAGFIVVPRPVGLPAPGGTSLHLPEPVRRTGRRPPPVRGSLRQLQLPHAAVGAVPGRGGGVTGAALPGRRRRAAAAAQLGGAGRRRVRPAPAGRDRGDSGGSREAPGRHGRRVPGDGHHRAVRAAGRDHGRDPEVPAVRDRRHHQPHGRLRPGLGRAHRRVRRHRAGHRRAGRAARRPGADGRRGRRGSPAVPARPAAGPAHRQPAGVRGTGHALPGARRLRRGHGRAAGLRRGARPDGIRAGRRGRRGAGRGLGPGRGGAAAAGDLAARIRPARRRPGHRRGRAAGLQRGDPGDRGPARRRAARRAHRAEAAERAGVRRRGQAAGAPGVAGRPGPSQRPADRRAAGHDRRPAGVAAAAGAGAG